MTLDNQTPLFGCNVCAEEWSFPASDLRVCDGELWCQECWDASDDRPRKFWLELEPFIPAHEKRISELEAEVGRKEEQRINAHISMNDFRRDWLREQDRAEALQAKLRKAIACLTELTAIVRGECPALLDEDSGGSANLSIDIDAILRGESEATGDD